MNEKKISPKKRYVLRALELGKSDPEISQLNPIESVKEKASTEGFTTDKVIASYLNGYGPRPALAERSYKVVKNEHGQNIRKYQSAYTSVTYEEFHNRIKAISMSWRHHPDCQLNEGDFLATIGFASIDFAALDIACTYNHGVKVPLQSATSGADLGEILTNTAPVILASTIKDLNVAVAHSINQPSIRSIVVFDYDEQVDEERLQVEGALTTLSNSNTNTRLYTIEQLVEFGKKFTFSFLSSKTDDNAKMALILHSSGSTGKPKGAVISGHALNNSWKGGGIPLPLVTVLNAPLNHEMGRGSLIRVLNVGGTGYFTLKPDMSSLFEDIRLARPTYLTFIPRILELIYQHYQNEVTRRQSDHGGDRKSIEDLVQAEMKNTYLGDRLIGGVVGSAPTAPKVKKFIVECFNILMIEGYGNTEAGSGGLTIDGKINKDIVLDYKLRDVPELGYYTTDKPNPRGELCVKTKFGIKEYYKDPVATAALFDDEGYSCTGDIVEFVAEDELIVIDRRKDVLKLSQGEYVAVGTLGTVYEAGSAVIKQIYVYGNSSRSYLLAVVVPEESVIIQLLGKSPTEVQIKNLIKQELNQVAQKEELKSFEIPRDLILENETFSQANGLLSSVRKRLRPALKRKYKDSLEAIYNRHDDLQISKLSALKDPESTLSTFEKLVVLIESELGVEDIETEKELTFNELGGDSLGAALFSMSIEENFGVSIAADVLLSPTGSLKEWAVLIDNINNESVLSQPTFSSIHGKQVTKIQLKDLSIDRFINQDLIEKSTLVNSSNHIPKTVLLTGANGFLGHMLCLEWLKTLSKNNGTLICLIRAKDNSSAYHRLEKEFIGKDSAFEKQFKNLAEKHLVVLSGDISKPKLGLDIDTYQRLASTVDRICHPAAFVNHRLTYQHLFGPNVVGTSEVIKFAISDSKKSIDFISTLGVLSTVDSQNGLNEKAPLKEEITLSNRYASGYAASKWAGEYLLQQAHERFDLPINIVRCDMILADQHYKGQVNASDMLTRLLYSMAITGLAPSSFYQNTSNNLKMKAHYDGIPVDVLTKAIVGLSLQNHNECITYNAFNYLDDEVSLDSFVDWIESAGYSISRLSQHREWFDRIQIKLKSLPEAQKQLSALEVLSAYADPIPIGAYNIGSDNFQELVKGIESIKDIPHLSESYIHKYLDDMRILKMDGI